MKNEKGFSISIKDNRGNCTVVVVDGTGKVIDQVPLVKWNEKAEYYAEKYGELPPPPPPAPPVPPAPPQLPENVQSINAHHNKVTVKLKDGSIEKYDFNNPGDKEKFETKYGPLPPPPPPPMPPARGISFVEAPGAVGINASYPAVPAPPVMPAVGVAPAPDLVPGVREFRGEEEILLLITPKTTQQELDALVAAMKDKGIVLTWDLVDFKNGKLFNISGHLEADDGQSKFSASDFTRVIVSRVPASDKNHFRIRTYGRAVI
jgi:hypothetical protein